MQKKSEVIANQIAAKRETAQALLEKGVDLTLEDVAKAKELKAEIDALQPEYKTALEIEQFAAENAAELDRLNHTPVNRIPFPVKGAQAPGRVEVEGFAPAGFTEIEAKGDSLAVAYEEGDLGMSREQRAAINTTTYKHAIRNYLRKGFAALGPGEQKTLQEGSDSAGGFLVPDDVRNAIVQKEPTPTRLAGFVQTFTTSRDNLQMPKVNYTTDDIYTTGVRATWTGEVPASSTTHRVTDPVFGQIRIPVHTAMLSMPLTNDMVEDAAFPIVSWASSKFNETIDLLKDNMILNGTGIGQPYGILNNPGGTDQPAIVVTTSAAALTYDGLVALAFALPEQYDMNARFVFNKTSTGAALAKLKDSQNRPIWSQGYGDSGLSNDFQTKPLLGYSWAYSGFAPDIAANAYPIVFGDFRGYYAVNRVGFSVQVLRELYAETNQIVLLGRLRFGGQVAEPYRLKIQKCST